MTLASSVIPFCARSDKLRRPSPENQKMSATVAGGLALAWCDLATRSGCDNSSTHSGPANSYSRLRVQSTIMIVKYIHF